MSKRTTKEQDEEIRTLAAAGCSRREIREKTGLGAGIVYQRTSGLDLPARTTIYDSRAPRITPEKRERIRELWLTGMSQAEIARACVVSEASVYDSTRDLPPRRPNLSEADKAAVLALRGMSVRSVAAKFGVSENTVRRIWKTHPPAHREYVEAREHLADEVA